MCVCVYIYIIYLFLAVLGLRCCACRLSLVAASGGYFSLGCTGFSLQWLLLLRSTGSRRTGFSSCGTWAQWLWHAGSVVVAHGLSGSAACGIFPDQGSNPCPLHWQADSSPLLHQGSPILQFLKRGSRSQRDSKQEILLLS